MATANEIRKFSVEEVCSFLSKEIESLVEDTLVSFETNRVSGSTFLDLDEEDLREIVQPLGERKRIKKLIDTFKPSVKCDATPLSKDGGVVQSSWIRNFKLPEKFSRATSLALEAGTVTKAVRIEIIQAISFQILSFTEYPTSEEYTAVCRALVQKYPVLKDPIGNGIGSWKMQLRTRMRNRRRQPQGIKRKAGDIPDKENEDSSQAPSKLYKQDKSGPQLEFDPEEYEEKVSLLRDEHLKETVNRKTIRKLMKLTFQGRRKWIHEECPSVQEVIACFPALKESKHLCREMKAAIESDASVSADSWTTFAPKITRYAELEAKSSMTLENLLKTHSKELEGSCDDNVTSMLNGLHTLEVLAFVLSSKMKKQCQVLYRFNMVSNLDEQVMKLQQNHPYLAVVMDTSTVEVFLIT